MCVCVCVPAGVAAVQWQGRAAARVVRGAQPVMRKCGLWLTMMRPHKSRRGAATKPAASVCGCRCKQRFMNTLITSHSSTLMPECPLRISAPADEIIFAHAPSIRFRIRNSLMNSISHASVELVLLRSTDKPSSPFSSFLALLDFSCTSASLILYFFFLEILSYLTPYMSLLFLLLFPFR